MPASPLTRTLLLACALAAARSSGAQAASPDFDAVSWRPLGCGASPLTAAAPRGEVDLVGDAASPAAYVALDATYLYFRYRVNGDPSGQRGFAGSSNWNMLVQVPSGSAFQYQYQLSLDGDGQGGDTVEVWENSVPQDVTFNPLFTDEPDIRLFRQVYDFADATTVNTTPLARSRCWRRTGSAPPTSPGRSSSPRRRPSPSDTTAITSCVASFRRRRSPSRRRSCRDRSGPT